MSDRSVVVALASSALFYLAVGVEVYQWAKRSLENRFLVDAEWIGLLASAAGALWPCVLIYLALDGLYPPRAKHRRARRR